MTLLLWLIPIGCFAMGVYYFVQIIRETRRFREKMRQYNFFAKLHDEEGKKLIKCADAGDVEGTQAALKRCTVLYLRCCRELGVKPKDNCLP